jgi:uncharacterized membrane protein
MLNGYMKGHGPIHCQVTGEEIPVNSAIPVDLVRESLVPTLQTMAPDWDPKGYVSLDSLNEARKKHVEDLLAQDEGSTKELHQRVFESMRDEFPVSQWTDDEFEKNQTIGQKLADKIASFGGSWSFISLFGVIIVIWMAINVVALSKPFDPYPFILLNLVLSCLAAMQAPVIMMSQNRQEARDRMRSINDYQVNLKAELEIRHLHEKLDKLMQDQWKHLLEIQQMQVEMIQESNRPEKPLA